MTPVPRASFIGGIPVLIPHMSTQPLEHDMWLNGQKVLLSRPEGRQPPSELVGPIPVI